MFLIKENAVFGQKPTSIFQVRGNSLINKSSIKILGIIFGMTLFVEILTWLLGAPPEKSMIRLIGLTGMFLWLLSGSRFARFALSVVYFLSALWAALSAARPSETPAFVALFLSFSTFSLVAAVFFIRSTVLRALTDPVSLTIE